MKKLVAMAAFVLLPAVLTAQTRDLKFTNDGAFAAVSGSDSLSSFTLQVSRGSVSGSTTTNLVFTSVAFSADLTNASIVEIVGPIPNSSFSGDNTKNLTLSLDPSTLDPTVTVIESCSIDFTQVDPILTCGALPPGTIQLAFQENDLQRQRLLAQEQFSTFGPVTIHSHQRADSGSATVQGTILGTSVSSANASVGINHLSTIEFTKN
jgi:hypothetical protein